MRRETPTLDLVVVALGASDVLLFLVNTILLGDADAIIAVTAAIIVVAYVPWLRVCRRCADRRHAAIQAGPRRPAQRRWEGRP